LKKYPYEFIQIGIEEQGQAFVLRNINVHTLCLYVGMFKLQGFYSKR